MELEPSRNCTVPVAVEGETVAASVTDCPYAEGLTDEPNVVLLVNRHCSVIWAVWVSFPEIPVIVMLNVPVVAVALAVSVNVLVVVVLVGLNCALTPPGSPEADKITEPVNPFCGFTVIVIGPLLVPGGTVTVEDDVESLKLGAEFGQLFTKLVAFTLPIPVAKSHPRFVPYAGL